MAPANAHWTASTFQQYKFSIIALTCLVAGATIYYAQNLQPSAESTDKPGGSLHRSNATHRRRRRRSAGVPPESDGQSQWEQALAVQGGPNAPAIDGEETENDGMSELFWEGQDDGKEDDDSKDGQSLLLLLFKIAEEQSRTDGYVHRGVACDSCNESPIKGVRYRCVNCADHDLCETCESTQTHNRQHLFLKIRIPAPQIGTCQGRQPVFYPGKPKAIVQDLRKEKVDKFCKETGYKSEEVEALWEQFRSMAATEWPNDPEHYGLAIDRPTFDRCFVPRSSGRPPPPNLIYNRIFSYYDANDDGLIGFAEFIRGLASLKRKNMAERMKRIFKAYDMNNDGYVDRKDFLSMFRAYYAHTKELMGDITASMQDKDDQDARELVTGGQPLSSAFNGPGPIHSGDIRDGRAGKRQNSFGDHVVVDGIGAVDEHEFDPDVELGSIISENAEAAYWARKKHPMSRHEFPDSGYAIYKLVISSSRQDLDSLMKYYAVNGRAQGARAPEDVDNAARHILHGRLAEELRSRRCVHRSAIVRRAQRHSYYQHQANSRSSLRHPLEVGGMAVDPRPHTQMGKYLEDIKSSDLAPTFNKEVIEMVKALRWPIEKVSAFTRWVYKVVEDGWSSRELSQALDGYSPVRREVQDFVSDFTSLLSRMAHEARLSPRYESGMGKHSEPENWRSSSKVRHEGSLDTIDDDSHESNSTTSEFSNSKLWNESVGAFEAPEPETDVGREVLFAVTEEALNELLDPVFKLREDLSLRALLEKRRRARYRANIIAAVPTHQNLRDVKLYLERYSRRWRQKKDNPPPPPHDRQDEAESFSKFVKLMAAGKVDSETGTRCTECVKRGQDSWVRIGEYCTQTEYHSKKPRGQPEGRRLEDETTYPAELCPMCAQMDKESWIVGLYCGQCGQPCSRLVAEEAKIRQIIETGGDVPPSDVEDGTSSQSPSPERGSSPDQALSEVAGNEEEPSTPISPPKPSKSLSDPSTEELPQSITPDGPATVYTDTGSYPDVAHDLHNSVAAFNSSDNTPLEVVIASKPLDDLLAESGYSSIEAGPPARDTPPPDPTLPQNRPNTTSSHPTSDTNISTDPNAPNEAECRFYACLDILKAEDRERAGPGRINFEEFEEIMMGEKGVGLGFLASWVEIITF